TRFILDAICAVIVAASQRHIALTVNKVDGAVVAGLVGINQAGYSVYRKAYASGTNIAVGIVHDPVVDKDADSAAVGCIGIHVDAVGGAHVADVEVPDIGRIILAYGFEDASWMVVLARGFRDKKGSNGAVL